MVINCKVWRKLDALTLELLLLVLTNRFTHGVMDILAMVMVNKYKNNPKKLQKMYKIGSLQTFIAPKNLPYSSHVMIPFILFNIALASRILRVEPGCAPSDGSTYIKFIGIGFTKNPNQIVKFHYLNNELTKKCEYLVEDDCIHCETPDFESNSR